MTEATGAGDSSQHAQPSTTPNSGWNWPTATGQGSSTTADANPSQQTPSDQRPLIACITSLITATTTLIGAFWLPLTDTQQAAISGLIITAATAIPTLLTWHWRK